MYLPPTRPARWAGQSNGVAEDIPMATIFRGELPFRASGIVRIVLFVIFPSASLVALRVFG
jgi:hypothetical protein